MKYLLLGIIFASNVWAGNAMVCDSPVKDFGVIEEGNTVSHTFAIKNISAETIYVDKVISSCGCIVTSKKDFSLEPAQSTDIAVEFNSRGSGGMKLWKTVAICVKDGNYPPLVLTVKANVKGIPPEKRIVIMPNEKTLDGDPDKKTILKLQVPSDPNIKFSIDAPKWLVYSLQKSKYNNITGIVNWDIEISLKAKQREKLSGEIVVNSNVPRFEKITVPIQVLPRPAFNVSPYMITFKNGESRQEVRVRSGDYNVEAVRNSIKIQSSKECLKVNWLKDTPATEIWLEILNDGCDSQPAKLEILLAHDVVGIIPIVFN
jgi:hypothetical protein